MYLFELFNDDGGDMVSHLRMQVMDYLTPLAANKVEFVPVQTVAEVLRNERTGLVIDRSLLMKVLDPNECKVVKSIEGDKIYLALPVEDMVAKTEDDAQKDKIKVAHAAAAQAKKEVAKRK